MKKILALSVLTILTTAFVLTAATPRALTFEDLIKFKRLSDIQLSPGGDLLAFVVTEYDQAANKGNSDIWVVSVDGSGLRRLTSSPQADFAPRWSPDRKSLAFISTRGGSPQAWTIDLGGGEARPLTSFGPVAAGPLWSATGKQLAFTASVFPDCPDEDCNKKKIAEQEQSQVQARLYQELFFRHWNEWSDGRRSHLFVQAFPGGKPVDLTPGDFDTPPSTSAATRTMPFPRTGPKSASFGTSTRKTARP